LWAHFCSHPLCSSSLLQRRRYPHRGNWFSVPSTPTEWCSTLMDLCTSVVWYYEGSSATDAWTPIDAVRCRGPHCSQLQVRYAAAAKKHTPQGAVGADGKRTSSSTPRRLLEVPEYTTPWFGHDAASGQFGSCTDSFAVRKVECQGYRCGRLRLTCARLSALEWVRPGTHSFKSTQFGEGQSKYKTGGDMGACPTNQLLTGIRCAGHHCRYMSVVCTTFERVPCSTIMRPPSTHQGSDRVTGAEAGVGIGAAAFATGGKQRRANTGGPLKSAAVDNRQYCVTD
jgi:hypothetical protein